MAVPSNMIDHATQAMQEAYAPYSNFHVGVCIRTDNDKLFVGANIENASYSLTLCAEATAIANMIMAGYRHINEIVIVIKGDVVCPPCGGCRQRIAEFANSDLLIHMCSTYGQQKSQLFSELFPQPFNSDFLE